MKKRRQTSLLLAAIGAGLMIGAVSSSYAAPTSVGASFKGRNATPADRLARTDSAGAVAQTYWNNVYDDGSTFKGTTDTLLDSAGNFTGVQIVYDCNDSWSSDGGTATPNQKLMKGILKANPDPDTAPTGNTDRMLFTITNLPAGTYNVLVYGTDNGVDINAGNLAEMDVTIGSTTYYIEQEGVFPDTFIQALSTSVGNYNDANYAEFDGVAAAANGTIVITAKKNVVNPQLTDGIGVCAIQVVQVTGANYPANGETCSVTSDPTSTLTIAGGNATFVVGSKGPCKIQWQKNGVDIAGANDETLVLTALVTDDGAQITALVYNNTITNRSAAAILSVDAVLPAQLTQGFLKVDRWEGLVNSTGSVGIDDTIAAITNGGAPTISYYVSTASVPQTSPDLSNFGARMSGWVKADVTGDYNFFIRSDDSSALFINSVAAASGTNSLPDVANDTPVAYEYACCNGFQEPGVPTQTTVTPIHLVAGKYYGITALYKEAGGGDFVQVAWRNTTDTTPAGNLAPIGGGNLYIVTTPAGHRATITTQPQSITVFEGRGASFSVAAFTTPSQDPFGVQWLVNGTPAANGSGNIYSIPVTTLADNGKQIVANVLTLKGALSSNPAILTVLADTNPPICLGASAFPGSLKVGLTFDEDLDPTTAGDANNYKINGVTPTAVRVRTNVANEKTDEKNLVELTSASPLNGAFTVTLSGVKDVKNNAMASTTVQGKLLTLTITAVGSPAGQPGGPDPQVPSTITAWGPGAFDVLCNGNDYWNNADGFNFVWEAKTNSFDVKVRVVSVSPINQWAAGALEVREGPPTANGAGWELARHYFTKVDYSGPDPSLDGSGTGANAYEFNCRRAPGDPALRETSNNGPGTSQGWGGTGPGNPGVPPFPNAWIRTARVKNGSSDHLIGYTSTDGVNWSQRQDVDLNDAAHAGFLTSAGTAAGQWPDVCYVGMASVSHTGVGNGNTTNAGTVGAFDYSPVDQPYMCYVIYREYGDVSSPTTQPTLSSIKHADGTITLTFTGVLYSSDTVNGTYTPVAGASSPFPVNPSTSGKTSTYYRAGP